MRDGTSKCETHRAFGKWADPRRGTSTERGYGAQWRRVREFVMKRDCWLCQCPECLGGDKRLRPATECHHIRAKADGGDDSPANLMAINAECHARITAGAKGPQERPKFDRNGKVVW